LYSNPPAMHLLVAIERHGHLIGNQAIIDRLCRTLTPTVAWTGGEHSRAEKTKNHIEVACCPSHVLPPQARSSYDRRANFVPEHTCLLPGSSAPPLEDSGATGIHLLSAPLTIPLVCCHINHFRRAASCGEARARRRKEEKWAGLASRGM